MSDYLKAVQERVVIYDGAMGTAVQAYNLPLDEFWGKDGYNDILVLSRPDVVKEIHASYFDCGADVVETNTFSSTRIVMAEYDMATRCTKSTSPRPSWRAKWLRASVQRAQALRCRLDGPDHQAAVARPHRLRRHGRGYTEQAIGLIEGGVDVLLLETCQDICKPRPDWSASSSPEEDRQERSGAGAGHAPGNWHDAAWHRDRRGAHYAGDFRRSRHRHELRHRAEGDERRRSLPGREFAEAGLRAAQRRLAAERGRPRGLQARPQELADYHSGSSPSTACASSADAAAPRRAHQSRGRRPAPISNRRSAT